jgi:Tol biopolymer transport system component
MAGALDAAHRHGVVHRDLKPGNVMLTKTGGKLLDFGLAKASAAVGRGFSGADRSALSARATAMGTEPALTAQGTILGTLQYMAPEQLEGKEADARSDIWAFGAIVYEMITGRKAFEGGTPATLIASILDREPPAIQTVEPLTPAALGRIVGTCLAKLPDDRWQSARDIALQLRAVTDEPVPPRGTTPHKGVRVWQTATTGALMAAIAAGAFAARHLLERPDGGSPVELNVMMPPDVSFFGSPALSPDGRSLVFVATRQRPHLWLRPMAGGEARALPGTEDAFLPFWSPDSRSVAFFASDQLKRLDLAGGIPQVLAPATTLPRGGTWNGNGVIVFAPGVLEGLAQVPAAGGPTGPVTQLDPSQGENSHRYPHFLPDGRRFLFRVRSSRPERTGIYVGSLDSREYRYLIAADSDAIYAAGHLLFARGDVLFAQPFDPASAKLRGEPVRIAVGVRYDTTGARASFSATDNGILAFYMGEEVFGGSGELIWFDRSGKQLQVVAPAAIYLDPALSPDGKRLAVEILDPRTGGRDIWVLDLARGSRSRLTFDPVPDMNPVWSPDGTAIIFTRQTAAGYVLFRTDAGGAAREENIGPDARGPVLDWSRDGRLLLIARVADLWTYPTTPGGKQSALFQTPFTEPQGRFSHDGKWVAYTSNESGRNEIYVRDFPEARRKWIVSTAGGVQPEWSGDDRTLYYISTQRDLMQVSIEPDPAGVRIGAPMVLFRTNIAEADTGVRNRYVADPSGKRFLRRRSALPRPSIVKSWQALRGLSAHTQDS